MTTTQLDIIHLCQRAAKVFEETLVAFGVTVSEAHFEIRKIKSVCKIEVHVYAEVPDELDESDGRQD